MTFLDTVGLLALWDATDQWHEPAEQAFRKLADAGATLTTTTFVLLECGNAAARRPYRSAVDSLRVELARADLLIRPTDEDWALAWDAYRTGGGTSAGIVDHVSFCVMRRLGLTDAFTNDRHFRVAGFHPLF